MNYKYFKAKFTGLSTTKDLVLNIGKHNFYDFYWSYIQIKDIECIDAYNVEQEKIGDYFYTKKIHPKKNWYRPYYWSTYKPEIILRKDFFWIDYINIKLPKLKKRPDLFISVTEQNYFNENLHDVILKDIELEENSKNYIKKEFIELNGTIFFKIEIPEIKKPVNTETNNSKGLNSSDNFNSDDNSENTTVGANNEKTVDQKNVNNNVEKNSDNAKPLPPGPTFPRVSSKWLGIVFGTLIWLILLAFFWIYYQNYFIYALIGFVGWFVTRFFGTSSIFKTLFNVVFAGAILIFLISLFSNKGSLIDPTVPKKDGNVKVSPPKPIKKDGASTDDIDYSVAKDINWFDFISNQYQVNYNTSVQSFFETQREHTTAEANYRATTGNPLAYFNKLYTKLELFDEPKIDSIVKLLGSKATAKKLNQIETAEMVTTFIQEIPYVLVHQGTCQEVVRSESGSSFVAKYHADRKPCLADVPGGVQSPYEFLHNLKGDCDTRSLLGYAILKKMNISASVWVSQAYGHSILGVGLPIGNGVYKTVNGIKHYGVELTNKGFRLGMISPQQRDMSNWDVALFSTQY
jgi:hypothetical protein